jgi:BirA family biotin operon repressor/biotin-[acetyl-CoA-carboxylase] ligase
LKYRILARLQEVSGEYISGTVLARELGVTRTAIWKHIESLKEEGYQIKGVPNRGYRLTGLQGLPIPPQGETEFLIGRQLLRFAEVDSTNDVARELLARGKLGHGSVILAERQRQGRGRRGRNWESPDGGLWFSVVLFPEISIAELAKISLVSALAVAGALRRFVPSGIGVKWPNDVLLNRRKAAGILLEMKGEFDKIEYVIIGIGINVNVLLEDMSPELREKTTSLLHESGEHFSLDEVLGEVLIQLETSYNQFLCEGWPAFQERFNRECTHRGHPITVQQGEQAWSGVDRGVDEWGRLLVAMEDGTVRRISTGDVLF